MRKELSDRIDEKNDRKIDEKIDEKIDQKKEQGKEQEKEQKTSVVYICGDFIEHTIVGNKTLPFFRRLSLASSEKQIAETYDNPFYIKLNTKFIQNLQIWVLNEKGNIINSSGEEHIFLTFHFRKRKWK